TPSRRNDKTVKPRVQHNPAGIHLNPAGRCPNNRGQLCVFATVRHRTVRTKGSLSQQTAKLMVFKLIDAASKTW
ncbi:hypothetical protein, partial [Bradyrhizobium sp. Mp27]|uniref:hypothetical protein n=1 Tax=Bradyrhizobium sp. Mp27 TaxID=3042157 RepID=UPI00248C8AA0